MELPVTMTNQRQVPRLLASLVARDDNFEG